MVIIHKQHQSLCQIMLAVICQANLWHQRQKIINQIVLSMHCLEVMLLHPLLHVAVQIKLLMVTSSVKHLQSLQTYKRLQLIYTLMMRLCQVTQNVLLRMALVQAVPFPYYKVQQVIHLITNHIYRLSALLLHLPMCMHPLLTHRLQTQMLQIWLTNGAITALHHLIK